MHLNFYILITKLMCLHLYDLNESFTLSLKFHNYNFQIFSENKSSTNINKFFNKYIN